MTLRDYEKLIKTHKKDQLVFLIRELDRSLDKQDSLLKNRLNKINALSDEVKKYQWATNDLFDTLPQKTTNDFLAKQVERLEKEVENLNNSIWNNEQAQEITKLKETIVKMSMREA